MVSAPSCGVLFDLEGTLVDTGVLAEARERRHWNDAIARVPRTALYSGVSDMLAKLDHALVPWAIVTNVPSKLADPIIAFHRLKPAIRLAYHDARPKPAPDGCLKAMRHMGLQTAIGVGDTSNDAMAFASARVPGYCAGWNPSADRRTSWTEILTDPSDVIRILSYR